MIPYLLAAGAVVLTLVIYGFAHAPAPRYGPDAAGLELFYLMVCPVRWLLVAALLWFVLQRGGFAWISRQLLVAGGIVLVVHAAAGVLSIASFLGLRHGGTLAETGAWVFGYVMPIVLVGYSLALRVAPVGTTPLWVRAVAILIAVVTLGGSALGTREYQRGQAEEAIRRAAVEREQAASAAQAAAEVQARTDSALAAVRALPPDAPIASLLAYLRDPSTEVRDLAKQLVAARPRREEELAALLSTDDRVLALEYLWWHYETPPAALAEPFRASLESMPDWTERTLATPDEEHATLVNRACEAVVVLASAYKDAGLDLKGPIERLHTFITSRYGSENFRAPQLLDGWLSSHR